MKKMVVYFVLLIGSLSVTAQNVGSPAIDFSLQDLDGNTFTLSENQGKVVVLYFIAYWCTSCQLTAPQIQSEIEDAYSPNDLTTVALDVANGSYSQVQNFQLSTGITYPILLNAREVANQYNVSKEYIIVIDREGTIIYKDFLITLDPVLEAIESAINVTSIGDSRNINPLEFRIIGNYPNPFNPRTSIKYYIPSRQSIMINIYSITGQLVKNLYDGSMDEGVHDIDWDSTNEADNAVSSGIYFVRIFSENQSVVHRLVLMK